MGRLVQLHLKRFPQLTANTYIDHPWPGWDGLSVDFWGSGGRGSAIPGHLAWPSIRFQMRQAGKPDIRHIIYEHSLWTPWGGWQWWDPDDHSGRLRHVHITFQP